jgi:transmembrane sensor
MSIAGEQGSQNLDDAEQIEARAADWFQRQQFWDWSAEQQNAFDSWLAESSAHRVAFLRLKSGYERTERLVALRAPLVEEGRRIWPGVLGVAASLAAIAVLSVGGAFYISRGARSPETAYTTPVGGQEIIRLADGSQIELNTDTVVRLSMDAGRRIAKLEKGEAYFQIVHDDLHPFVVETAGHRVTDLGTQFSVRNQAGEIEVALVEGRARLESANSRNHVSAAVLTPGDVAVATAGAMSVRKEPAHDIANALSWRHGLLVFHNTSLADAAAALNRYNRNKLVIDDPKAAELMINGTFGTHDVEFFARMTQAVFGLRVTSNGTTTRISH